MRKRPLSFLGCILTGLLLISLPCTATMQEVITKANDTADAGSYLLVQHGTKATIEQKTGENNYTLTLQDVSPYVAYFSDRPNRKAGTISIEEFLKLWERQGAKSFQNDPPNANFNAIEMGAATSGNIKNFSMELSNPKYDKQTNTLVYTIRPLAGTEISAYKALDYITLVIDDVCLSCW